MAKGLPKFLWGTVLPACLYPLNAIKYLMISKQHYCGTNDKQKRVFDYRHELLPNSYLSDQEKGVSSIEGAVKKTGLTIGYPSWNLLYYSLICSLFDRSKEAVVVRSISILIS
ncbi:MAG: hypothetical protein Q8R76_08235 [Candidatus Omnitrophota bacterium]|nr:hypothetical protein [Candidatus Omnitrophota bacterium]